MQTGTKISGIAHLVLIGWAVFGGAFSSDPLPFEVAEVSVISAEEYAALTAPARPPAVAPAPEVPQAPQEPEQTPVVEPAPEPETPQPPEPPAPQEAPEAPAPPPDVDVSEAPPAPEPEQEQVSIIEEPKTDAQPKPSDRVAPEVVAPPPPEARPDKETKAEVAPDDGAQTPQEPQEATAPEEASDRIVPETQEVAVLAPTRSVRPPSARPKRPAPTPAVASEPKSDPAPQPKDTTDAVRNALAEALGGTDAPDAAPAGPPLSAGEKDALRVSVSRCWNVGALSSSALATTVVVKVSMAQDGKPDVGSIRMLSNSGGDGTAAKQAFEAARRAIIRCGSKGFDLPAEKYAHWRDIEMTFNPERMRIK
ncbi:energy transducer TonB [Arenibacterium sp. CAU 1754]